MSPSDKGRFPPQGQTQVEVEVAMSDCAQEVWRLVEEDTQWLPSAKAVTRDQKNRGVYITKVRSETEGAQPPTTFQNGSRKAGGFLLSYVVQKSQ